jgi:hypothetical protein
MPRAVDVAVRAVPPDGHYRQRHRCFSEGGSGPVIRQQRKRRRAEVDGGCPAAGAVLEGDVRPRAGSPGLDVVTVEWVASLPSSMMAAES